MGGAGGTPPPPARRRPATRSIVAAEAYERRLKLTDVIGFVALNGYAREANACAGLNRETWRCIPAGLSASDADRVRRDHPLWQAIINLRHGALKETRLGQTSLYGHLARVRELCDWRADIEAADTDGCTPLYNASVQGHLDIVRELLARGANIETANNNGATSLIIASYNSHLDIVRELLARGANVNAVTNRGWTPLILTSYYGHVKVIRALLAAGADKRRVSNFGETAASLAGTAYGATLATRAAILALLAAAP